MTENLSPSGSRPENARSLDGPTNSDEANRRADWWEFDDPFSDIVPALLSAVQIENYARVCGSIYPFSAARLKGTTYEVGISGTAYFWDSAKKMKRVALNADDPNGVIVEPNSITFVETDVEFRLPHYLAVRFNLHIKLVHRGLLLGTGPLVDPGFRGRLLIPLHNLTTTPYTIQKGEKLVWIEFTKTSYARDSAEDSYRRQPSDYRIFPDDKRWLTADDYLTKANAGNPIASSISGFIASTNKKLKKVRLRVNRLQVIGYIALTLTVIGLLVSSISIYNQALTLINSDRAERVDLEKRLHQMETNQVGSQDREDRNEVSRNPEAPVNASGSRAP